MARIFFASILSKAEVVSEHCKEDLDTEIKKYSVHDKVPLSLFEAVRGDVYDGFHL